MKKRGLVLLVLFMIITLVCPVMYVLADMIVEPDDSFFSKNRHRTEYIGRSFYANGEDGFIPIVSEPGSNKRVDAYLNGETIFIQFTISHGGERWGLRFPTGWVPMSQLVMVYDQITFAEENDQNWRDFDGDLEKMRETMKVVVWTWPGSGEIVNIIRGNHGLLGSFTRSYTDAEGREWGILGFQPRYYNWVCISDPSNEDIPAFNAAPIPDLIPAATRIPPPDGIPILVLITILVVVLVGTTAVLIRVFWKKRNVVDEKSKQFDNDDT